MKSNSNQEQQGMNPVGEKDSVSLMEHAIISLLLNKLEGVHMAVTKDTSPKECKLWARICTQCGNGMNSGLIFDTDPYCSDTCVAARYDMTPEKVNSIVEADSDGDDYYTDWEDLDDYEILEVNNTLITLEECLH